MMSFSFPMNIVKEISNQPITPDDIQYFQHNNTVYCLIKQIKTIDVYEVQQTQVIFLQPISFSIMQQNFKITSFCVDNGIIYIAIYHENSSEIYSTSITNLNNVQKKQQIDNIQLKQIIYMSNKLYYITQEPQSQFFVFRDDHVKLKNVKQNTKLVYLYNEVFCIEENDLIFVTKFKRRNIEFGSEIVAMDKSPDGMIFVFLASNVIHQITQDSEQSTVLLNISKDKLLINNIFYFNKSLYLISNNTFYVLNQGKLTACTKTKYQALKMNTLSPILSFITPTREAVFIDVHQNQTLSYLKLFYSNYILLQLYNPMNIIQTPMALVESQSRPMYKQINLLTMQVCLLFHRYNNVVQIYQDGDYFAQLMNDRIIINQLLNNVQQNLQQPNELAMVIGECQRIYFKQLNDLGDLLFIFQTNDQYIKIQEINIGTKVLGPKIKVKLDEYHCHDIILQPSNKIVIIQTREGPIIKLNCNQLEPVNNYQTEVLLRAPKLNFIKQLNSLNVAVCNNGFYIFNTERPVSHLELHGKEIAKAVFNGQSNSFVLQLIGDNTILRISDTLFKINDNFNKMQMDNEIIDMKPVSNVIAITTNLGLTFIGYKL